MLRCYNTGDCQYFVFYKDGSCALRKDAMKGDSAAPRNDCGVTGSAPSVESVCVRVVPEWSTQVTQ